MNECPFDQYETIETEISFFSSLFPLYDPKWLPSFFLLLFGRVDLQLLPFQWWCKVAIYISYYIIKVAFS